MEIALHQYRWKDRDTLQQAWMTEEEHPVLIPVEDYPVEHCTVIDHHNADYLRGFLGELIWRDVPAGTRVGSMWGKRYD